MICGPSLIPGEGPQHFGEAVMFFIAFEYVIKDAEGPAAYLEFEICVPVEGQHSDNLLMALRHKPQVRNIRWRFVDDFVFECSREELYPSAVRRVNRRVQEQINPSNIPTDLQESQKADD